MVTEHLLGAGHGSRCLPAEPRERREGRYVDMPQVTGLRVFSGREGPGCARLGMQATPVWVQEEGKGVTSVIDEETAAGDIQAGKFRSREGHSDPRTKPSLTDRRPLHFALCHGWVFAPGLCRRHRFTENRAASWGRNLPSSGGCERCWRPGPGHPTACLLGE